MFTRSGPPESGRGSRGAGTGFEPVSSGRDRALRTGLDDHGSLRLYAEMPRGPHRSLLEQHGNAADCKWPVSGRGSTPTSRRASEHLPLGPTAPERSVHFTSGWLFWTDETTSMMAWAVTAASFWIRIRSAWVAPSTTRCTLLVDRVATLFLRGDPGGVAPAAGRQDVQRLVAEVGKGCSLVSRCIGLEVLVEAAAKTGGGGELRGYLVCRLRWQTPVAGAGQTPQTQPSRGRHQHGGTSQDVVWAPNFPPRWRPATRHGSRRSAPARRPHLDSGPQGCVHSGHRRSDLPTRRDPARLRDATACAGRSRSARRPEWCRLGRSTRDLPGHRRIPGCARRPPALSSPWPKTCRRPPAAAPRWGSLSQCSTGATGIRRRRPTGPASDTRSHPGARARSRSPRPPRQEP